ncbi:hypothetical protein ACEPAG_7799 [Sanghuangporus baumii]
MPEDTAKQKKSRRRLRVSCVECTRRRQKCDRTQPCGLCRRRGVEHLCRWELEPFARPLPSRPTGSRKMENKSSLERPAESRSSTETPVDDTASRVDSAVSLRMLESEVKEAAIALAQLSVARHGEYLGTGSLVCALHRLNDHSESKLSVDKSSGLPFSSRNQYSSAISNTFSNTLYSLISSFPLQSRCNELIEAFFEHDNWRYGIPKAIMMSAYHAMWDTIQTDRTSVERISFNWVTLLLATLALSSGCASEEESRKYFLQALTSKRLAEDVQSASFFAPRHSGTYSQGTAHGCLAAALIADYLCDRGQMTEAWKLIGSAVRNAQNAGLYLNPAWNKWKDMTEDEQTLRSIAWHGCATRDRFLSFALGRPAMVHSRDCFVPLRKACPPSLAADGSSDIGYSFQICLILLMECVSEEKDKYFCIHPNRTDGGKSFDGKISLWEASLPSYLALHDPDTSLDHAYPRLRLHRCLVAGHYYFCRMLFHRSLLCIKLLTGSPDEMVYKYHQWDSRSLSQYAIDLLHAQRSLITIMEPQRQICFMTSYFIFEAAVTLSIVMCRDPGHTDVAEWRKERDEAIELLHTLLDMDNSELTQQAIVTLRILQDRKSRSTSVGDSNYDQRRVNGLLPTTPDDLASTLPESQNPVLSSMFPMNTSHFQDPTVGLPDQLNTDTSSTSPFNLSGFDFLFNSVMP